MKRKSSLADIIVIGGDHHNTLGVIRSLGIKNLKENIHLIIEAKKNIIICKTKYLKKDHIHFYEDKDNLTTIIKSIARLKKTKPVVIACGDKYISLIDERYDTLKDICFLPNANHSQGRINYFLNKEKQSSVAKRCGLNVAEFTILNLDEIKENTTFPCIIKPINSIEGTKSDIKICRSRTDIDCFISLHNGKQVFRVEQFIDKIAEFQLIGCSLPTQIIIPGYTCIIRQPHNTNTGYLVYKNFNDGFIKSDLIEKVKNLINLIGYVGLFSVEFIRGKDEKDYFLEINLRNDGNAFCVTTAGINLPYIWYIYWYHPEKIINEIQCDVITSHWMPEADFRNIQEVGFIKWVQEWLGADSHGITSIKDPYPIVYKVIKHFLT